ncbi:MAG: hypothetical protein ACJ76F_10650 [Bacteroidia bacterium]
MQKIVLLCVISVLVFSFCSNEKKFEKQTRVLDSLTLELEKGIAVYKTIDTVKLKQKLEEYEKQVKYIAENVKDTISLKDGEVINAYKGLSNAMNYLVTKNRDFITEIELSKQQLKDLSEDIKNNKIEDAKAFEYYTQEQFNAESLLAAMNKDIAIARTEVNRFDSLNGEIKAFIGRYTVK